MDVYVCPSLESPYPRHPSLDCWYEEPPYATVKAYVGDIREECYFGDERRIPREPVEQRAVLADGIEMVTRYGKEPADHPDGANVLFADMVVQWVGKYMPDKTWVMDKHKVWPAVDARIGAPGYYGVIDDEQAWWFPYCQAGTWRRSGYIQNPRLLHQDPNEGSTWGGGGTGEDDVPNDAPAMGEAANDVDDIYYVDCDMATWGAEARYGFISYELLSRCRGRPDDKSKRDCSLAGGSVFGWRGSFDAPWVTSDVPAAFGGMTWGHPDELR
jgi:prepilin-type processing-associated H-X9-DG protein